MGKILWVVVFVAIFAEIYAVPAFENIFGLGNNKEDGLKTGGLFGIGAKKDNIVPNIFGLGNNKKDGLKPDGLFGLGAKKDSVIPNIFGFGNNKKDGLKTGGLFGIGAKKDSVIPNIFGLGNNKKDGVKTDGLFGIGAKKDNVGPINVVENIFKTFNPKKINNPFASFGKDGKKNAGGLTGPLPNVFGIF